MVAYVSNLPLETEPRVHVPEVDFSLELKSAELLVHDAWRLTAGCRETKNGAQESQGWCCQKNPEEEPRKVRGGVAKKMRRSPGKVGVACFLDQTTWSLLLTLNKWWVFTQIVVGH